MLVHCSVGAAAIALVESIVAGGPIDRPASVGHRPTVASCNTLASEELLAVHLEIVFG